MTIGKRVAEALDKFNAGDAEAALLPLCAATDATAQKYYAKTGRGSYKEFIAENMHLITKVALGVQVINLNIAVPQEFRDRWPKMKLLDSRGLCPAEEILYHVVRCGLLHDAELHPKLVFQSESKIKVTSDEIVLPEKVVFGLAVAVVACPSNKEETMGDNYGFEISGFQIPFDTLWGKKDKLMRLYEAMDDFLKNDSDIRPQKVE